MDSKLTKSLQDCRKSCLSSLKALASTSSTPLNGANTGGASTSTPMPSGVSDAFSGLLVTLRQTTTALGLAFKPPISVDAAIAQLDKISDQIGKLISCVILTSSTNTKNLSDEWKDGVEIIGNELSRHLELLAGQNQEAEYLSSTGMVWTSIDRLLDGLSKDEKSAVGRKLRAHQSVVKDAWEEFKGILEAENGDKEDQDEDEVEDAGDGWDELDLGGEELSEEERRTAEAAKPILALHQILQATIPRFLDQFEGKYEPLLSSSSAFVDAYDRAVSSMHPEQDAEEIEEALEDLEAVSKKLAGMINDKSMIKWSERLEVEKTKWDERRMDMRSLANAI